MAREERIIYVYDDFSCDEPVLLGKVNSFPMIRIQLLRHGQRLEPWRKPLEILKKMKTTLQISG